MKHSIPELPEFILSDEALPASLREFVRVLGLTSTLRVLAVAQGGRITVPKKPQADDPWRAAMGDDAYLAMVKEYGGEVIDMPKADAFIVQIRHQQVRFYRQAGLTMDQVAVQTGYCKKWVINILHDRTLKRDPNTHEMFPDELKDAQRVVRYTASNAPQRKPPKLPEYSAHDPFGMTRQRA